MLTVNVAKTFAMHFSNLVATTNNNISFNDELISFEQTGKFLGLLLDNKLKFNSHIKVVSSKVAKLIGIFYKLKDVLPEKSLVNLYYIFVYPYFYIVIYSSEQKDQNDSSNERKSSITSFMEPIKPQNCKNFFLTQWVMKWETCFLILPVIKIFKHN